MKALITGIVVVVMASPSWAFLGLPYAQEAVVDQGDMRITAGLTMGQFPDSDGDADLDIMMLGVRFGYGVMDGLELFGGIGLVDFDFDIDDDDAPDIDFGNEPYVQIGGLYTLPLDLPFDLALRGSFGFARLEDSVRESEEVPMPGGALTTINMRGDIEIDIISLNAGLLASKALNPMLSVYGFGGFSHNRAKMSMEAQVTSDDSFVMELIQMEGLDRMSESETETSTDLALAGGLIVNLAEQFSLYAEVAHIDELWASVGGRFRF